MSADEAFLISILTRDSEPAGYKEKIELIDHLKSLHLAVQNLFDYVDRLYDDVQKQKLKVKQIKNKPKEHAVPEASEQKKDEKSQVGDATATATGSAATSTTRQDLKVAVLAQWAMASLNDEQRHLQKFHDLHIAGCWPTDSPHRDMLRIEILGDMLAQKYNEMQGDGRSKVDE